MTLHEDSVKNLIDTLNSWEKIVSSSLAERLPAETIHHYLDVCRRDPLAFYNSPKYAEEIQDSLRHAVSGVSIIKQLIEQTKQKTPEHVSVQDAARFAFYSFQAGLFVGMSEPGRWLEKSFQVVTMLKDRPKKAAETRHAKANKLKKQAVNVAISLWENGSTMKHHRMKKYLIEEYEENGKYPFVNMLEKPLLDALKLALKHMGRLDLISGLKKII